MSNRGAFNWIGYYSRDILRRYRADTVTYDVDEDDMGGIIESNTGALLSVRFGHRSLDGGTIAIAALDIDIARLPEPEAKIWEAHRLVDPIFQDEDPRFDSWFERNLEASWGVEDGPLPRIRKSVELINAVLNETIGMPLWKFQWNPRIHYPLAENTDSYADAHLELYRLLIDGLDGGSIEKLATQLEVTISDQSRSMNSLKEILPSYLISALHKPLEKCYAQRQKKHGIPHEGPRGFPAFQGFENDVMHIADGLEAFSDWLGKTLSVNTQACLERFTAMNEGLFPEFDGPPQPEFKLEELRKSEGKTIVRIEFGHEKLPEECHQAEALIFHFADGTALTIKVGSNVNNILHNCTGIKASDFATDLMVFWAPSITQESN